MKPLVFRAREDHEVGRVVVQRIAVHVMNDLVPCELPTFTQLNDVAVFGDPPTVDTDKAVAALEPTLAADESPVVATPPRSMDAARRCVCDLAASARAGL